MPVPKPMPEPTPVTRPFWDGLRDRKVRIQYSPSSNRYVFYPRVLAPGTLADDLEWREISGRGVLYTFSIAYRATAPPWSDSIPQMLAVVEWDEGPRFSTEIVDARPSELRVGMRVAPVFCDFPEHSITMLKYAPERAGERVPPVSPAEDPPR